MADRVLIFASDPGRVRAELPIQLPRPRDADSPEVRALIDEVYALMTGAAAGAPAARADEPARMHLGDRLPEADVGRMEAPARAAGRRRPRRPRRPAATGRGDRAHRRRAAAAGAGAVAARLGAAGRWRPAPHASSAGATSTARTRCARSCSASSCWPTCRWPRTSATASSRSPRASCRRSRSCELLSESLDAPTAERVLRTAIEWGRYGEVFEFDLRTGQIHLPAGEEAEKNAL